MENTNIDWPVKQREVHSHHFDSTIWNDIEFRDDDIIISTYAKSGTTWVQQIVGQLLFDGRDDVNIAELSPWMDLRIPPKHEKLPVVEAQSHRRFLKTHLPVDALVFSPKAKYIYIGRDGRDVVWSMYNHHANANEKWYKALNDTPGRVGPPIGKPPKEVRQYFVEWLRVDGHPWWPYWENVRSWWAIRSLPNMLHLHFNDLKADLPGQIRRVTEFLDISIDDAHWDSIVEHCTFDWMKKNASKSAPLGGIFWDGGADTFIHKGTNGRWADILSLEEVEAYEKRALGELGSECADWLANGSAG